MIDRRLTKLAEVLIGYSTNLQKGEKVLIDAIDVPSEIVVTLIRSLQLILLFVEFPPHEPQPSENV